MTARRHSLLLAATFALAYFLAPALRAQDAAPASGSIHEQIQALRQLLEEQTKQIQLLSEQIARLSQQLGNSTAAAPSVLPGRAVETPVPVARPVTAPPANAHIVVKGDSLDKIARTYSITVAELLKLNKITDPKKIQIGQQILLPPNVTPAPAPAAPNNTQEGQ